ncbi:MAG TPA: hypothetical protein VJU59_09160 [Paraburkholderia sp.]|uniref:hypothetical protein n=1 Tax=Paraburkholderia sp. TaxID=1926495 RepID=UPI002B49CD3A|nr:hypothetical protein [Paraburkholderia sp.]HKR39833.1 hypothetical protein [Paraburkholderia sp.]
MNWNQFQKNIGMRMLIEPPACRLTDDGHILPESHDEWLIESVSAETAKLRNLTSDHVAELGKDHIYDYRSDPSRTNDDVRAGFLVLKMQIFLQGPKIWLRPNARPGERVAPSNLPRHQVQWTQWAKVDCKKIPPNARSANFQYHLWSDVPGIPLRLRISSNAEGTLSQELSGDSGVAELMIIEQQTFYVSFGHPSLQYDIGVIGYKF